MQFSRKTIAIIALVIILAASNVAFAVLYMTRNVNISGGVASLGSIQVYDSDGITPLTSYDFPLFTRGVSSDSQKNFFINNTGTQEVCVYWNISSSSIAWFVPSFLGYQHTEAGYTKYSFAIYTNWIDEPHDPWIPNGYSEPEALFLGIDEGMELQMDLAYTGLPDTAGTFTLVLSFYAYDGYQ